jgi:hypothetical protein
MLEAGLWLFVAIYDMLYMAQEVRNPGNRRLSLPLAPESSRLYTEQPLVRRWFILTTILF